MNTWEREVKLEASKLGARRMTPYAMEVALQKLAALNERTVGRACMSRQIGLHSVDIGTLKVNGQFRKYRRATLDMRRESLSISWVKCNEKIAYLTRRYNACVRSGKFKKGAKLQTQLETLKQKVATLEVKAEMLG